MQINSRAARSRVKNLYFLTLHLFISSSITKASTLGRLNKTVLEVFSGNGVAFGLCRFVVLQAIQQRLAE